MSKNHWSNQSPRMGHRAARGFGKNITHTQVGLPSKVDESIPVTTPEKSLTWVNFGSPVHKPKIQQGEKRVYVKGEVPKHYSEIRSPFWSDKKVDNPPCRDSTHTVITMLSHTGYMESVERARKTALLQRKIREEIKPFEP